MFLYVFMLIWFRGLCFGPVFTSQCREVSPTGNMAVGSRNVVVDNMVASV